MSTKPMKARTTRRFFPDSEVTIVHQNGAQLTLPSKGIEVILHTRENERDPCCAEVISGDHYAEIGLWFQGKALSDYDGVFFPSAGSPRDVERCRLCRPGRLFRLILKHRQAATLQILGSRIKQTRRPR